MLLSWSLDPLLALKFSDHLFGHLEWPSLEPSPHFNKKAEKGEGLPPSEFNYSSREVLLFKTKNSLYVRNHFFFSEQPKALGNCELVSGTF